MMRILIAGVLVAVIMTACGVAPAQRQPEPAQTVLAVDWTPEPAAEEPEAVETERTLSVPKSFADLSKRQWQKVVKSPDATTGKGFKVWACITQFDAATGDGTFRGNASYKNLKSEWYLGDNSMFTGSAAQLADFVAGDIVSMSVVNLGSYSYDTQIGGNTTVPIFQVVKIKRAKGSCS